MIVRYSSFLAALMLSICLHAEHYAGGSLTTRCTGDNAHDITLQLFRNCTGAAFIPQTISLTNDCGVEFSVTIDTPTSTEEVSLLCDGSVANSSCNGGSLTGMQLVTYTASVYLSPCSNWRISWGVCCRGSALNTVGLPGLYLETLLNNTQGECGASPTFDHDVIPTVCVGQPVNHDASATSTSGHRLSYHLIDARFMGGTPTPLPYASGNSGEQPFPGMVIDTITGTIRFTPTATGAIVTAVEVREFDGTAMIGTVMRDFLFIATNCANTVPSEDSGVFLSTDGAATIIGDRTLRVCTGQPFCASLSFSDVDAEQVLTLTSDIEARFPGATVTMTGTNPLEALFCWNNVDTAAGEYGFSITVKDDACPGYGTQHLDYVLEVAETPDAGISATAQVCENGTPFPLLDELGGTPGMNGTWTDPQGNSMSGVFAPGTTPGGAFEYEVASPNGCAATSTVTVEVIPASDPNCLSASIAGDIAAMEGLSVSAGAGWLRISSTEAIDLDTDIYLADGRAVLHERVRIASNGTVHLTIEREVHGLCIVRLTDRTLGRTRALRAVMP